jgi:serine protease Do
MISRLAWLLGVVFPMTLFAVTPAPELQKRVRAATFEVVVPKASEANVTYERPPPVELLPYVVRNDKYWSIGTAFALGRGTFVSAAHVIQATFGALGGPPSLRDADGKTYAIDRILKYSAHQDFVVFTARELEAQPLASTAVATVDEPVFAVGNALGEGVVIRDGLLTSMTPEDQDGRWKWLRYSAATSPGNSGGPLLNAAGQVIGVVIGKSPSENLNYALPIALVDDSKNEARVDVRSPMRVPFLRDSIVAKYDITIPLPLPLAEFERRLRADNLAQVRMARQQLLTAHLAEVFPRGKSEKLLASIVGAWCPVMIMQSDDHSWVADDDRNYESAELPDGGRVLTRVSASTGVFAVRRGSATDPKFYTERRAVMDLLLKGLGIARNYGSESVKITSLGAPASDVGYRDNYGRRWQVASFPLPFDDASVIVFFLPTPDGYAGMLQFAPRGSSDLVDDVGRFATDYFHTDYSGTLPQWAAFLARADQRPLSLDGVTLRRDAGGLHFVSRRLELDVPPGVLEVSDKSVLRLQMAHAIESGVPTWGIGAVYVNASEKDDTNYFGLIRQPKPSEAAGEDLAKRWSEMLETKGAFSRERGHDADYQKLWRRTAIGPGYRPGATVDPKASVLYEVLSVVHDAKLPKRIDDMQDLLLENVRLKEH